MAITSSGQIMFASFNAEFGLGYNLNAYYGCDPWLPVPRSGTISFANFYSADNRTAEITGGKSNDGYSGAGFYGRYGWAEAKGSGYLLGSESSENRVAFGSISKNLNLSTGQRIVGLYASSQFASTKYVAFSKKGSGNTSTTGGFTQLKMRFNNAQWRYGDPITGTTNYDITLNRTSSNGFAYIQNTLDGGGTPTYSWYWYTNAVVTDPALQAYYALYGALGGGFISFKVVY